MIGITQNKLIAEAFYLTGDIEKYGSGFIRIREAIKDYPSMRLEIKEYADGFFSELRYKIQKQTADVVEDVVERQKKIIQLLKANSTLSAKKIANRLKVTERTIQRDLKKLVQQHKITREGTARGGKWIVVDS